MAVEIKVSPVGESVTEATVSRWLKPNGAAVRANEPVCELETDKATKEEFAPVAGVLSITVPEGQKVSIGTVIGRIEPGAVPTARPEPDGKPVAAAPAAPEPGREARLSPAAQVLAANEGVDPRRLTGTGRGGLITKENVLDYLAATGVRNQGSEVRGQKSGVREDNDDQRARSAGDGSSASLAPDPRPLTPVRETRQRMSTIRQRIAERLLAAQQNAAILTTFNEADLSAILALRAKYKDAFQKKHGVGLGFMSFFVKAVIEALHAFPAVNARIDGGDVVYQHYYDVGVAVSTEKGLMVPVLRDADRLSFAGIEKGIAALAQKARDNQITVNDLMGGTFTITNGGVFGSLLSTPILNPPQSGILGMHAIQKRPVTVEDQVVIRPMMYLAFSYDHRLIDGREAVSFLVRVKECIEGPERLMLEV
jgi:2-oxoglutarate dehydrogenase E2 component (dihydrolipoamide succinyltransferase)